MKEEIRVGFAGNPNCGKTTLFNAYTGANLKVANWPGVTVEKKEGETSYKGQKMRLIDLPGIYSLTSYSMEEMVSRKVILGGEVDDRKCCGCLCFGEKPVSHTPAIGAWKTGHPGFEHDGHCGGEGNGAGSP